MGVPATLRRRPDATLLDEAQRRVLRVLAAQAEGLLRAHDPDRSGPALPAQRLPRALPAHTP